MLFITEREYETENKQLLIICSTLQVNKVNRIKGDSSKQHSLFFNNHKIKIIFIDQIVSLTRVEWVNTNILRFGQCRRLNVPLKVLLITTARWQMVLRSTYLDPIQKLNFSQLVSTIKMWYDGSKRILIRFFL